MDNIQEINVVFADPDVIHTLWYKPTLHVVFTVPDAICTLWIKSTLNEVFPVPDMDILTRTVKADELTTMVIYSKVIQKDGKTRGSKFCKSVGDLSLATAAIEAELEQPQAMGGGAQGGSAAGRHASEKHKLPGFGMIVELRKPHRRCPKTAQADLYTTSREV